MCFPVERLINLSGVEKMNNWRIKKNGQNGINYVIKCKYKCDIQRDCVDVSIRIRISVN